MTTKMYEESRQCDECGCESFIRYRSMNKIQCTNCDHTMDSYLKENQSPLLGNNRQKNTNTKI